MLLNFPTLQKQKSSFPILSIVNTFLDSTILLHIRFFLAVINTELTSQGSHCRLNHIFLYDLENVDNRFDSNAETAGAHPFIHSLIYSFLSLLF